ncbi:hypothetical protein [Xanthovirga aplysinae]|uniref:hypothetical protein n=1 Tax=Xanthovirga aplysinae TaxID=2529853 RepID=UPI0012BC5DCE|nr:hypothetical protein [Xanthovirga aplysinae]MTI32002.1 hypothetical protein [Xanthovirga aplysinae]
MKYIRLIGVLFFILQGTLAEAQKTALNNDPQSFGGQLYSLMQTTKNANAIALGEEFKQLWDNTGFGPTLQKEIIDIALKMQEKRLKSRPYFEQFMGMLIHAKKTNGINDELFDELLKMTQKALSNYDSKTLQTYFVNLRLFFESQTLYQTRFYSLYAKGGTYSFEFLEEEEIIITEADESLQDSEPTQEENEDWFSDWDNESDDNWNTDWESFEEPVQEESSDVLLATLPEVILPPVKGAVIHFNQNNLVFVTPYDSVSLQQTNGEFLITEKIFVGEGGRFDWSSTGLSGEDVYATFDKYSFAVNKTELSAEQVKLTYNGKIKEPVEGVFEFKSKKHQFPEDAQYPRFKSYDDNIKVENLGADDLVYKGGFSLNGNKIYSSSLNSGTSTLEVGPSGHPKFVVNSRRFDLKDSLITSPRAAIVIYQGSQDSIYHPAVQFSYNKELKQLRLLKDKGGFKNTPYTASLYEMELRADLLKWDLNTDSLDFSVLNASNQVPATFSSLEYFNKEEFNRLSGIYDFHPLLLLVNYSRKNRTTDFYLDELLKQYQVHANALKGALIMLMQNGYIDYDKISGHIKVKRKALHYVFSDRKRKDFDNLNIPSVSPSGPNATLSLKTNELKIRGVKEFTISEYNDVKIKPKNYEIVLLNNRDFRFDGMLFAGNLEYEGKNFYFDYDQFLVDLPEIDTIRFHINTGKRNKSNKLIKRSLDNVLVNSSGTLYVDKPDNKSSTREFPQYPLFKSSSESIVYFNKSEILDGAYDKSVFFLIPPFELDSMNKADGKAISFDGTMETGGIFPSFEEKLTVMDDNSLGFVHEIPSDGYTLFEGKAKAYKQLNLNNKGLVVNGEIEYLTTELQSEAFTFYLDSVKAIGSFATIDPGVLGEASFPQAFVEDYAMVWKPSQDSLAIDNLKQPFDLYDQTASLEGAVVVSEKGVSGQGRLLTRGSEAISDSLNFQENLFVGRHARFEIKSDNPAKPALRGSDVNLTFQLDKNLAEIGPEEEGNAAIDFPYAQMRTSISKAYWDLQDKTVRMSKPEDVDLSMSYFYSTRKELDSLAFNAEEALYDINSLKLNISGIPYIKVADAKIIPDNNEALVLENSQIKEFTNAMVLMDTLNEYHTLYDGKIRIYSRNEFEGSAIYQLVTAVEDTFAIRMNSFVLEQTKDKKGNLIGAHTVSSAEISDAEQLGISPGMLFKGTVKMYAHKKALELDGFVKLDMKSVANNNTWIQYKSDNAQSQEVIIDFDQALTDSGNQPKAGLFFDAVTQELYGQMVESTKEDEGLDDFAFFVPKGKLRYDPSKNEYIIQEKDKAKTKSFEGRQFTFNEESGAISFEGPVNFLQAPKFKILASGKGDGNIYEGQYQMNALLAFDFGIPLTAAELMVTDLTGVIERLGIGGANRDKTQLLYRLGELEGDGVAKVYEEKSLQDYVPLSSISKTFFENLVLSDVDLNWSDEHQAWFSDGKIGFSNMMQFDVNGSFDGYVEIKKHQEGDLVNVFIQASPGSWYYISYEGNRSYIYASNEDFNRNIQERSKAGKANIGKYAFSISDLVDANDFVNRFRSDYLGKDDPIVLELPMDPIVNTDSEDFDTIQRLDDEEGSGTAKEDEDDGF